MKDEAELIHVNAVSRKDETATVIREKLGGRKIRYSVIPAYKLEAMRRIRLD